MSNVSESRSTKAGAKSPKPDISIRQEIWHKLMINVGSNPLAVLVGLSNAKAAASPWATDIWGGLRKELRVIAAAYGFAIPDTDQADLAGRINNHHKPSMLIDFETGRPMEIDEILMAPLAFAHAAEIAVPKMEVVAALTAEFASQRGLYQQSL